MAQLTLFDLPAPPPGTLPEGMIYQPDFLDAQEEAELIAVIGALPLAPARYKSYTARRRVLSFGGSYDYDAYRLLPAQSLAPELMPLRERIARWLGVAPEALAHALVAEYRPGTPLGWHRDVLVFRDVCGVSLGSEAVMRLRPYPPSRPRRTDIIDVPLAPRSIYALRGPARWQWQHSVAATPALRWSITFRTMAQQAAARTGP